MPLLNTMVMKTNTFILNNFLAYSYHNDDTFFISQINSGNAQSGHI